jgi:STE24 endopeptidase
MVLDDKRVWLGTRLAVLLLAFAAGFAPAALAEGVSAAQSVWRTAQSLSYAAQSLSYAAQSLSHTAQSPSQAQPYSLPPDKMRQAVVLGVIRPMLSFGAEFGQVAVLWLLLASGMAARLADWVSTRSGRGWLQAALYSALLVALLFLVVNLTTDAVGHVFSLRYGISIEPWPEWLLDQAKTLGLTICLETPAIMLVYGLMRWNWSRKRYWLWFAIAAVPVSILGTFLLPSLIDPMFNQFEPLAQSHPALVAQLERVVERTGTSIPPERMFLMKASEKTTGLNAYVTGIGASKRIVVWDTTADRMPTDEILFTFAHESGHYVLHHIPQGLAFGCVGMFAFFWAAARLSEWFVRRFGARWRVAEVASLPGLAVLVLAVSVLQIAAEPIGNAFSRHIEHEADVYGQEAIHGLVADPQKTAVASFNRLGEAYLDAPNPNPFIVVWTYNHPSTQSRAEFAADYDPWAPGRKPRFFSK